MELILVRHGEAVSKQEDPNRPLSKRGRGEVQRATAAAVRMGLRPSVIIHSGILRARQTAKLLAEALKPAGGQREAQQALDPNADPVLARSLLSAEQGPLMLVGHLPQLERLASLLLTGDPQRDVVGIEAGALVHLSETRGRWTLQALVPPNALPAL